MKTLAIVFLTFLVINQIVKFIYPLLYQLAKNYDGDSKFLRSARKVFWDTFKLEALEELERLQHFVPWGEEKIIENTLTLTTVYSGAARWSFIKGGRKGFDEYLAAHSNGMIPELRAKRNWKELINKILDKLQLPFPVKNEVIRRLSFRGTVFLKVFLVGSEQDFLDHMMKIVQEELDLYQERERIRTQKLKNYQNEFPKSDLGLYDHEHFDNMEEELQALSQFKKEEEE